MLYLAPWLLRYFKLISFEVTVLVNGLAVKRITAVTFVSGLVAVSDPALELDPEPADEEPCELAPEDPAVET